MRILSLNRREFHEIYTSNADTRGFRSRSGRTWEKESKVVALCADLTDAIKLTQFKENFLIVFYQMGIKEADMIGTAAGDGRQMV